MPIIGLDHIQLAMPVGRESEAREFYVCVLGLAETSKPESLAGRGGVWFENARVRVHLGVDPDFRPGRKAHPGFLVENLDLLVQDLLEAGHSVHNDEPINGFNRIYVNDPFGNRLEFLEPGSP